VSRVSYNSNGDIVASTTVAELTRPADTLSTGDYKYSLRFSNVLDEDEYYLLTITSGNMNLIFKIKVKQAAE